MNLKQLQRYKPGWPGKLFNFLLSAFLLISCDDQGAFDCVKKAGKIVEMEIPVGDFKGIFLYDGVDLYIKQGQENNVVLKTGENLAPGVRFETKDGILSIRDENYCNWVRSYGDMAVYVTTNQLQRIKHFGFGQISSVDTLKFESFVVESKNGPGDINLNIKSKSVNVISNSISNISISGATEKLTVGYYYGDGQFDGKNLISHGVSLLHLGTNIIAVHPIEKLTGSIESNGDVYYYHDPETLEVNIKGKGKLVRKY